MIAYEPCAGVDVERDGDVAGQVLARLREQVAAATRDQRALVITGGDTKAAIGRPVTGAALALADYRGILAYSPSELVITARAGTPLTAIDAALAARGQMLGFEPPRFGAASSIGGIVAAGLSGPRRPYAGAVRDFVLGVRVMNGQGEVLRFGGQVMKNVAGYDVPRLMTGAHGTLGVLVEVSLRVLPRPACELGVSWALSPAAALARMVALARRSLSISGLAYADGRLHARIAGDAGAVAALSRELAPDAVETGLEFWESLRDLPAAAPADGLALWRLGVPPAAPALDLPGRWIWDWGGAQRWLVTDAPTARIRDAAERVGGHASRMRGDGGTDFAPLAAPVLAVQRELKSVFDPAGIFNPGRLYPEL